MICSPLAASDCLPPIHGVWVCENRFNHAINLRNASNQLLTLHRYGHGISPMGWLIRRAEFDQLSHYLAPGTRLTAINGGLFTRIFSYSNHGERCIYAYSRSFPLRHSALRNTFRAIALSPDYVGRLIKLPNRRHLTPLFSPSSFLAGRRASPQTGVLLLV